MMLNIFSSVYLPPYLFFCLLRSFVFFLSRCWILRILYIFCIQVTGSNFKVGFFLSQSLPSPLSLSVKDALYHWSLLIPMTAFRHFVLPSLSFLVWFQIIYASIYIIHSANNYWASHVRGWPFLNLPVNTSASSGLIFNLLHYMLF